VQERAPCAILHCTSTPPARARVCHPVPPGRRGDAASAHMRWGLGATTTSSQTRRQFPRSSALRDVVRKALALDRSARHSSDASCAVPCSVAPRRPRRGTTMACSVSASSGYSSGAWELAFVMVGMQLVSPSLRARSPSLPSLRSAWREAPGSGWHLW